MYECVFTGRVRDDVRMLGFPELHSKSYAERYQPWGLVGASSGDAFAMSSECFDALLAKRMVDDRTPDLMMEYGRAFWSFGRAPAEGI